MTLTRDRDEAVEKITLLIWERDDTRAKDRDINKTANAILHAIGWAGKDERAYLEGRIAELERAIADLEGRKWRTRYTVLATAVDDAKNILDEGLFEDAP